MPHKLYEYTKNEHTDCNYMTLQLDKVKSLIYSLVLHKSSINNLSLNGLGILHCLQTHNPTCTHT